MPVENVVALNLTRHSAEDILQEISMHSGSVFFTAHAEKRMRQRKITRTQVIRCLQQGHITEGPARSTNGNWELKIEVFSAGQPISVVVALDHDKRGNYILVITVICK